MGDQLFQVLDQSENLSNYYKKYIDYLHGLMSHMNGKHVEEVGEVFLRARENGRTIFFAGNGGSAATASHFSQDLAELGKKTGTQGFRTLPLTDNVSRVTAVANDYGYDEVFTAQMADLFSTGDVLVVISASGNSPNVVLAAELALEKGGTVVALVGFDGGRLKQLAHHSLHLETPKGEYGPVEDAHMMMDHIITTYLMHHMKDNGR